MNTKIYIKLFLISHFSFLICPVRAQMVSEIKIVAIQEKDSLAALANGYEGGNNFDLDFRKGRGGGYVFALFKQSTDTAQYITDVRVEKRDQFGIQFSDKGKEFLPAPFFQAASHLDKTYRGGLNGRNYSIYGGAYPGQPHVYFSRTGNTDFKNRVLKKAYVSASKPKNLPAGAEVSGGHAGGGRYFVFEWHTHETKCRPLASQDINYHERYCDKDNCGVTKTEPHRFDQRYGVDAWMIIPKTGKDTDSKLIDKSHYKQCIDCKQIVYDAHNWATYTSDWGNHNKRCLVCDYVIEADHKGFGDQKLPVDEYYHMIYCEECGFLKKLRHEFDENRTVMSEDCDHTVVKYKCRQCFHEAYFEEPGLGHDFDAYGLCRRNCLHPYEQPEVERQGNDSVFVIKNYGNLYWIADYVNNRRPKTNIRLANDLYAEEFMRLPWRPIGAADSTAFQGTFDGGGHYIAMLQTEEPVAGTNYRGLFGAIGKDATVKDVTLVACNIRGWDYIGAVAGINEGTINNCHVVFSIMSSIGSGKNLGGICGLNKGTISACTTKKDVWVGGVLDYAGGICGTNEGGTLSGNVSEAICGSGSDGVLPEAASNVK